MDVPDLHKLYSDEAKWCFSKKGPPIFTYKSMILILKLLSRSSDSTIMLFLSAIRPPVIREGWLYHTQDSTWNLNSSICKYIVEFIL